MKITKLVDYKGGWVIGNFDPSAIKTDGAEIVVKYHLKGETVRKHFHKLADEVSIIIYGVLMVENSLLRKGDVLLIEKNEKAGTMFLEDSCVVTIKVPSIPNDKYEDVE